MIVDRLTAILTADTQGFEGGMNRAQAQLNGFAKSSDGANHGVTVLRRGIQGLAIEATGVGGPIGHIITGLLTLGAGSSVMLGVAAGIGGIAAIFHLATKEARDLEDANKKLAKSFDDVLAASKPNVSASAQFVDAQIALGNAQQRLHEIISQRNAAASDQGAAGVPSQRVLDAARNQVNILTRTVEQLGLQWHHANTQVVTDVDKANEGLRDIADNFAIIQGNIADIVNDPNFQSFIQSITVGKVPELTKAIRQMGDRVKAPSLSDKDAKGAAQGIGEKIADPMKDALDQAGFAAGQAFVEGLMNGVISLRDLLKAFIAAFLQVAIVKVVHIILGIASPSRVAFAAGANFSQGLAMGIASGGAAVAGATGAIASRMAGTARFSLNMSGMPAATNPLAAARDGQWQRFVRETAIVARGDGFKFA